MGDQLDEDDVKYARDHFFGKHHLNLNEHSFRWILNHIDCFDRQARRDKCIRDVRFFGYSGDEQD
jgi:hypothetical protein